MPIEARPVPCSKLVWDSPVWVLLMQKKYLILQYLKQTVGRGARGLPASLL